MPSAGKFVKSGADIWGKNSEEKSWLTISTSMFHLKKLSDYFHFNEVFTLKNLTDHFNLNEVVFTLKNLADHFHFNEVVFTMEEL